MPKRKNYRDFCSKAQSWNSLTTDIQVEANVNDVTNVSSFSKDNGLFDKTEKNYGKKKVLRDNPSFHP